MSKWATLAVVSALIGLEADILGLLRYQIDGVPDMSILTFGSSDPNYARIPATPALIIVAFLLYVAMASLVTLTTVGLAFDKNVAIATNVLSIVAAVLLVAGTGNREDAIQKFIDKYVKEHGSSEYSPYYATNAGTADPYGGVLEISAAALAVVVFVATILHLTSGGASGEDTSVVPHRVAMPENKF